MIKLKKILKEIKNGPYEYGCVMLYFDFNENQLTGIIDDKDVYDDGSGKYGKETEPHVTLLYGLHSNITPQIVQQLLDRIHFGDIHLSNVSVFESDNYDVLKMDAVGDGLSEAHKLLSKLPNSNEFTEYHPHMTIAYLEKEMWQSYTNRMRDIQFQVTPIFAIYSIPSGKKFKLKIK